MLLLAVAGPAAAQACTDLNCENHRPTIAIDIDPFTTSASRSITIVWQDDSGLSTGSRLITFNGDTLTSFSHDDASAFWSRSTGSVAPTAGLNTLEATICDTGSLCQNELLTFTYGPPSSGPYAAPAVVIDSVYTRERSISLFESTAAHSVPGYVSRDTPRGVSLAYSSGQALASMYLEVDATTASSTPASLVTVRVWDVAKGAWVSPTAYYQAGAAHATNRLSARWNDTTVASGARQYDVAVSVHYPRTGMADSVVTTTKRITMLVLNESASPFGAGWSLPGLMRVHGQTGAAMLAWGDGSARYFVEPALCPTDAPCTYLGPTGEFGSFRKEPFGAGWGYMSRDSVFASFDNTGRLTRLITRTGDSTSFGYDGSGRLTTITDAAGKQFTLAYTWGRLSSITDPGSPARVTEFFHTGSDLTRIEDPDNVDALVMTYAAQHRLKRRTARNGGVWGYAYDAVNRLAADSLPEVIADSTVQRPVVAYGSWELAARGGTTAGGAVPRINPDTLQASVTDPRGYTTRMRLNARFQPRRVVGPVADTTLTWYNPHGQPEAVTGPTGSYTTYTWSGADLLTAQTSDPSTTYSSEYDPYGGETLTLNAGLRVAHRYGDHGELLRTWVGTDSTKATIFTYHANDHYRLATVTVPGGDRTEFAYDATGFRNLRQVTVTTPDSTTRTITHFYDAYGRPDSVVDASGTVRFDFDLLNRQTLVVGPLQDSTGYAYTQSDTVQTVTDAVGKVYTFRTNRLGWLLAEQHPDAASRTYGYDVGGLMASRTDRRGLEVVRSYDAAGRVLEELAGSDTTTFSYGPFTGYFVEAVKRSGGTHFSRDTVFYDALGRVTRESTTLNGFTWSRTSYLRREGLRDSVGYTTPTGTRTVRFSHDHMGRLVRLTGPAGAADTTRLFHGTASRLDSLWLPSGLRQQFTYAPTHQPRTQSWNNSAVNSAFRRYWFYDALGRVTERGVLNQRRRVFGYDTGGRLATVSDSTYFDEIVCTDPEDLNTCQRQTGWNPAGDVSYTYDQVGNRTDSNARLRANTNRYRAFAGDSLEYDAEGNLTRRFQSGDDQFLYWNRLGQLDSVVTGSTRVSYGYNGFGQRIKRTQGSTVTISIYDGDDLLLEANGSNAVLREYLHYPGIDLPHSVRIGSTTYFYAMEQPGHVTGLATGTGTVAQRYRYSAWGVAEQDSGNVTQPLRFMARELDATTGLYYVRSRWYDPELARFPSEDPIGLAGDINTYAYARNEPQSGRDPTGLCRLYHVWTYFARQWTYLGQELVGCGLQRGKGYSDVLQNSSAGDPILPGHPSPIGPDREELTAEGEGSGAICLGHIGLLALNVTLDFTGARAGYAALKGGAAIYRAVGTGFAARIYGPQLGQALKPGTLAVGASTAGVAMDYGERLDMRDLAWGAAGLLPFVGSAIELGQVIETCGPLL